MRLEARSATCFLLGVVTAVPLTLPQTAAGDAIGYGVLLWPPIAAASAWGLRRELRPPRSLTSWLVAAFIGIAALSTILGLARYRSLPAVLAFAFQVLLLANIPLGWLLCRRIGHLQLLWAGFAASLTMASLVPTAYLVGTRAWETPHGIHNDPALRAAIYGWPNTYAIALAVAALAAGHLALTARGRLRWAAAAAAAIAVAGLFLTFSRTGYVAIVLGVCVWAGALGGRRLLLAAASASAAVAVLAVLVIPDFATTIFYSDTMRERLGFVLVVLRYAGVLTLAVGSGFANTNVVLASHSHDQLVPGLSVGEMTTHDEYLTILLKSGALGLTAMIGIFVLTVRNALGLAAREPGARRAVEAWLAVLAMVFASLFAGETLHYWPVGCLFWLSGGALLRLSELAKARERTAAL